MTFVWYEPANNGSPIASYSITVGGITYTSTSTTYTVVGLTNGTPYNANIIAINGAGSSDIAVSLGAIPFDVIEDPVFGQTIVGNCTLTFSWSPPANISVGVPVSYRLNLVDNNGVDVGSIINTTSTSYTFSSLTNGTAYRLRVRASSSLLNSNTVEIAATPLSVPGAPVIGTTTFGNMTSIFNWDSPPNNGSTITEDRIIVTPYIPDATIGSELEVLYTSTTTSYAVTGLTNGRQYLANISAKNEIGYGPTSSTPIATYTLRTVPAPPSLSATRGIRSATVTVTAGAANGSAITGYQYKVDGGTYAPVTFSTGTRFTVSLPADNTTYTIFVVAVNGIGTSTAREISVRTLSVPDIPTARTAVISNQTLLVRWSAPTNTGGVGITGYSIIFQGVTYDQGTLINKQFTGLTNGTSYTLQVAAKNIVGTGEYLSLTSTPIPVGTPIFVATTIGNGSLTFNWTPPTNNGGSPITGYSITVGGITNTTTSTSYTFTGLTNGVPYGASLTANNVFGVSVAAVMFSTPLAPPLAPSPAPIPAPISAPIQLGSSASSVTQSLRIRSLARTWTQPSGQNKVRTGSANPWIFARNVIS